MNGSIHIYNRLYKFDTANPLDISIPLRFDGPQPNVYGVEPASSNACESGDLVGDTRLGGSCNFERYTLIPHCNGTHTECVGHITNERISVLDCLKDAFMLSTLVTVKPVKAGLTNDTYAVEIVRSDRLITRALIETITPPAVFAGRDAGVPTALIIRTRPNDESKLTQSYSDIVPPYFTTEAMEYVVECGFKHLLIDLPSIDRIYDKGKLSNHRIFWNVEPDSFEINEHTRVNSTITELIYVPNEVRDGEYLLNLQIAPFAADASPSRPVLFNIE